MIVPAAGLMEGRFIAQARKWHGVGHQRRLSGGVTFKNAQEERDGQCPRLLDVWSRADIQRVSTLIEHRQGLILAADAVISPRALNSGSTIPSSEATMISVGTLTAAMPAAPDTCSSPQGVACPFVRRSECLAVSSREHDTGTRPSLSPTTPI